MSTAFLTALAAFLFSAIASAQLKPPNSAGVALGHLHFHSEDLPAHVAFWTEVLGAEPAKVGPLDVYKLPGVLIALTKAKPAGAMESSTVPAVGFRVRDLNSILTKAAARGIRVTDREESAALLIGPDGIRVQLTADPSAVAPVASERIRLNSPDPEAMRKWYVDVFGAAQENPGNPAAATLPGVRLEFANSATVAGTKSRVLDHIGFEVKDLRAFTKSLAGRGIKVELPYLKLPDLGIAIGFVTDPWGTYIELTEGLDRI